MGRPKKSERPTDIGRESGQGIKRYEAGWAKNTQSLSPKDKLRAVLRAGGHTYKQIREMELGRPLLPGEESTVGMACRSDKMQDLIEKEHEEIIERARNRLVGMVEKAAENYCEAIEEGDLKCSKDVLMSLGVMNSGKSTVENNVNVSFGEWLSKEREIIDVDSRSDDWDAQNPGDAQPTMIEHQEGEGPQMRSFDAPSKRVDPNTRNGMSLEEIIAQSKPRPISNPRELSTDADDFHDCRSPDGELLND